jgi:hypothetical protein
LNNCTVTGNTNTYGWGGGVQYCILNNCTLIRNTAGYGSGGGADNSILNNCVLLGNTEIGNFSAWGGGGASRSTLNNCTIIGNNSAYAGGGVFLSTLNSCLVFSNSASIGGGASYCTLNNCTIISNSASSAGGGTGDSGTPKSVLNNCIVYYNAAPTGSNYYSATLNYCCTASLPTNGVGNITSEPLFVDLIGGNFHLQSNSSCINSGKNSYVTNSTDFDGNPRIVGGTVDIGPYEYQTPTSILSYAWAQQYGLPTDGSADYLDSDGDGMNNWQEWKAGTIPTNPTSVLQLSSPSNSISGVTVTWQSVSGVTYYLQRSTNLSAQTTFSSIKSNIVGQAISTSYTDTTATNSDSFFYRVGVQ